MRKIFILAIFGITSISAFGRIGDTYQQSVKRFGKPIKYFKDKYAEIGLFEKLNYAILVKYNNGISYEETYAKLIPTALEFLRYKTSIRENKDFFSTEKYFTPLTKQQIEALLKANYNTSWSMTNKSQEECYYQAKSQGVPLKARYQNYLNMLIVTDNQNSPSPKAPMNELQIFNNTFSLGSSYNSYVKQFGFPYTITYDWVDFYYKNVLITVTIDNKTILDAIEKGKLPEAFGLLHKGKLGGNSIAVEYGVLSPDARIKHFPGIDKMRKLHYEYRNRVNLSKSEDDNFFNLRVEPINAYKDLVSMPSNMIIHILYNITKTKWKYIGKYSMLEDFFETWKNGRRLYGTYNVMAKTLKIEYGKHKSDFKPEVIKKIKAKKEAKELESF